MLRLLADGRFHSGEELGAALGVGRGAVWKLARTLPDLGLDVHAVQGKGYRLELAFEPLEADRVLAHLGPDARGRVPGLEVLPSVDSTNRHLMERAVSGAPTGWVCLAEHQSHGRGRRGRSWVSPFGANLYGSVLWRFALAPAALGPLSVVLGVAVAEAITALGAEGVGLKWPNDVYWEERKLAGILVEVAGEATGPAQVVVGVGVNVNMPPGAASAIDQPWVDLRTVLGRSIDRNQAAAHLIDRLVHRLDRFPSEGFLPVRPLWDRLDLTRGRRVVVNAAEGPVHGHCLGIDDVGALLLDTGGRLRRFLSGEVSLRVSA